VFLYHTKHNLQCSMSEEIMTSQVINLVQQIDWQVPEAAWSKTWIYSPSSAGIAGSNPAVSMNVGFECCVFLVRSLCVGLITRPEESYRLWCDFVCDLETLWVRRPWSALNFRAKKRIFCGMGERIIGVRFYARVRTFSSFVKLQKVTITLACLCGRLHGPNNLPSTGGIFMKFDVWLFF
jgi:hypothetical protein